MAVRKSFDHEFEKLARKAVLCNSCFSAGTVEPALIDLPQPKWVGPRYRTTERRVVIVLINPGAGAGWADQQNEKLRQHLVDFRDGGSLEPAMAHQREDMPNWGKGRFCTYFFGQPSNGGLGLIPDEIALVNIAWCATKDNRYPRSFLNACYAKHTAHLIEILEPTAVLLCGSATHQFGNRIPPSAKVFKLLHYMHREGAARQQAQLNKPGLLEALGIERQ